MIFLNNDDFDESFNERIKSLILDDYSLETLEMSAVQMAKGRLGRKFDLYQIFSKTGNERDAELVTHLVSIIAYKAWKLEAPSRVPNFVVDDYNEAKEFLERVSLPDDEPEALFTNLPIKTVEGIELSAKFLGKSQTKYDSRF
ncbi:hypothetical protein V9L05_18815 [Bernardetia sp. Wsw4-3y2]|uniref:hypothetical protein n=1 Tax=Bernardetia sp. Wsw4-3y2 TaxID=3127471 RepID=UPI0030D18303